MHSPVLRRAGVPIRSTTRDREADVIPTSAINDAVRHHFKPLDTDSSQPPGQCKTGTAIVAPF